MSDNNFHMRLSCAYESEDNNPVNLSVETITEDKGWQPLELNELTPGFLIYVYSMFACQHMFLRNKSKDKNVVLRSAQGEIKVRANEDWLLQDVAIHFDATAVSGVLDEDTIDYIISGMKACPVSKNMPAGIEIQTSVNFK